MIWYRTVNAAALSELRLGGHGNISSICYVTVGTGIGVGVAVNGQTVAGLMHPEAGHVRVPRHPADTLPDGYCPFHTGCLESLCNAAACAGRMGVTPADLGQVPDDHPGWYGSVCWFWLQYTTILI